MRTRIRELRRERRALPRPSSPRAVGTHATDHHLHRGREVTPPRCRSPTRSPRYFGLTIEGRLLTFSEIDEGAVIAMKKTAESLRADISRPSAPRGHLPCRHRCRHRRHSRPGRCRHPFRRGKQLRHELCLGVPGRAPRLCRGLHREADSQAQARAHGRRRAARPPRQRERRARGVPRARGGPNLRPPHSAALRRHRGRDRARGQGGHALRRGDVAHPVHRAAGGEVRLQAPPHGARGGVKYSHCEVFALENVTATFCSFTKDPYTIRW